MDAHKEQVNPPYYEILLQFPYNVIPSTFLGFASLYPGYYLNRYADNRITFVFF